MTCECLAYRADDPHVQLFGLGAAALRYQARGFAVVPLVRGGKRPHRMLPEQGGVHHGTLDRLAAEQWWASGDKAANVGVVTGQQSRLVVVDLDVKADCDGIGTFYRWLGSFQISPGDWQTMNFAPRVRTPSGGMHIWLRTPPGVPVPTRQGILPGVDIKGDGGLVVVPPSLLDVPVGQTRPGEPRSSGESVLIPYSWVVECPCAVPEAPVWLLSWAASAPATGARPGQAVPSQGDPPDLAEMKRTGVPRGQRNSEMYRLACSLYRRHGTSTEAAVYVKEQLTEVWQKTDRTDFGMREVIRIADSARTFIEKDEEDSRAQRMGFVEWMKRGRE